MRREPCAVCGLTSSRRRTSHVPDCFDCHPPGIPGFLPEPDLPLRGDGPPGPGPARGVPAAARAGAVPVPLPHDPRARSLQRPAGHPPAHPPPGRCLLRAVLLHLPRSGDGQLPSPGHEALPGAGLHAGGADGQQKHALLLEGAHGPAARHGRMDGPRAGDAAPSLRPLRRGGGRHLAVRDLERAEPGRFLGKRRQARLPRSLPCDRAGREGGRPRHEGGRARHLRRRGLPAVDPGLPRLLPGQRAARGFRHPPRVHGQHARAPGALSLPQHAHGGEPHGRDAREPGHHRQLPGIPRHAAVHHRVQHELQPLLPHPRHELQRGPVRGAARAARRRRGRLQLLDLR